MNSHTLVVLSSIVTFMLIQGVQARYRTRDIERSKTLAAQAVHRRGRKERDIIRLRPERWYDTVVVIALMFVMPVVQYYGYRRSGDMWSVLIPLLVFCGANLCLQGFYPNAIFREKPNYREKIKTIVITSVILMLAFPLPATGFVLVLRGALIDIFGMLAMVFLIHVLQDRPNWRQRTRSS